MVSTSDMKEIVHKLSFMPEYEYKKLDKKEVLYLTLGKPIEPEKHINFKEIRKPIAGDFAYFSYWRLYEFSLLLFDKHKEPCLVINRESIVFKTFIQILARMKERRVKNKLSFAPLYYVAFEEKTSKNGNKYLVTSCVKEYFDINEQNVPVYEELGGE